MESQHMLTELKTYLVQELLDGTDKGIDESTPLLEWGIVDSVSMTGLLAFIEQRFGIDVPDEEIVPEHFETLGNLVRFISGLRSPAPSEAQPV